MFIILLAVMFSAAIGVLVWRLQIPALPPGMVSGNGRLEATEIDVASKIATRVVSVVPQEGELTRRGQIVATLDADNIVAQLRAAAAHVRQAQATKREAQADIHRAESEKALAYKTLQRSKELVRRNFISAAKLDSDYSNLQSAQAALLAAENRVHEAEAAIQAAIAQSENLQIAQRDATLQAPIDGRVLYRLVEPGEIIPAGGKVLTLLDLSDVFMTIFLPTYEVGQLAIGSPARIVLDAWPEQVVPAHVSYVSPQAQFTPREVETRSEREKLMFRVKLRVESAWLVAHPELIKSGMPGMAYLRLDPSLEWPVSLQVK